MTHSLANTKPTGAELHAMICRAAHKHGVSPRHLIKPLTRNPGDWLSKLQLSATPKLMTIERVKAICAGEAPPPPPEPTYKPSAARLAGATSGYQSNPPMPIELPPARDPCLHCGTRRDMHDQHGCGRKLW